MTDPMVETRHPAGKKNMRMSKRTYELFEAAIIGALRRRELTHTKLVAEVAKRVAGRFEGNVAWCVMVVKLDLEARQRILRSISKPEQYRLA